MTEKILYIDISLVAVGTAAQLVKMQTSRGASFRENNPGDIIRGVLETSLNRKSVLQAEGVI